MPISIGLGPDNQPWEDIFQQQHSDPASTVISRERLLARLRLAGQLARRLTQELWNSDSDGLWLDRTFGVDATRVQKIMHSRSHASCNHWLQKPLAPVTDWSEGVLFAFAAKLQWVNEIAQ